MDMRSRVRAGAIVAAVAATVLVTGTAAQAQDESPNVAVVSTRFDKLVYQAGDEARVSFKLANYGQVDAEKVVNDSGGNGDSWELGITDWGGVEYGGSGITIPAGQTVTVVLRGVVPDRSYDVGRVTVAYGFGAANGDYDESNNVGSARASVPGATGTMTGDAAYDRNADNHQDPGEGLPGVKITVVGLYDITHTATVYTDANGHFVFRRLPVGEYEVRVTPQPGWWLVYGDSVMHVDVRQTESPQLWITIEPIT